MGTNESVMNRDLENVEKGKIFMELAIQGANDGFWTWDILQNRIYFRGSFKEYEDYCSDKYIPYDFLDEVIHPLDITSFKKEIEHFLNKETSKIKIETRILNGSKYDWILIQGKGMWDENGAPLYMAGAYTLITDFKNVMKDYYETQHKLKETKTLFKAFFENIPDPICIKDDKDRIIQCNLPALSFWGKQFEDIVGKKCTEINVCNHPCEKSITSFVSEQKKPIKVRKNIKSSNQWINIISYPVLDEENNIQFIIEHIQDITDLKTTEMILQENIQQQRNLLQEAKHFNKLRTEFFANISHDLKTPLNIIISTLQLLENYYLSSDKANRFTKIMKQNCYRLLKLINNLVDITKIDSGYFKLNLQNGDIVDFIKQITMSVDQYIQNKSINLTFESNIDKKIIAFDAEKIDRIMLNLLSNAAKFTPTQGEITVTVSEKNHYIIISVKDTGVGIPLEKQNIVFQRFGQVSSQMTRPNEGSGIGLSLVKSLIEMHGGTISFYSEEQKGTEFIIEIPIKILNEEVSQSKININSNLRNVDVLHIELSDIYA